MPHCYHISDVSVFHSILIIKVLGSVMGIEDINVNKTRSILLTYILEVTCEWLPRGILGTSEPSPSW